MSTCTCYLGWFKRHLFGFFYHQSDFLKILFSLLLFVGVAGTARAQVSGRVYREFNMNGTADAAVSNTFRDKANGNATSIVTRFAEVGLSGATLTVYGDNEQVLGTATTSSTGSWSVAVPGNYTGTFVLVECTPPASLPFLKSGPHGTDNGTAVIRAAKTATNVNFTFGVGSEHAQNSPDLAQACFAIPDPTTANGNPGNSEPMVIRFPYISGGPLTDGTRQTAVSSVNTNTGQNYYSTGGYPPVTTKTVLTTFGVTGSVYGIAYDKRRNRLLTSAFERAYTGLGAAGAGGEGKIYVTTLATSGTATGTTVWLDLETALSGGVAGVDPTITAGLAATTTQAGVSTPVTVVRFEHNKVGHLSLGDLEFSADGRTVFVVNLFSKQIYGIPVNTDGTPDIANIRTYTPTNPCTGAPFTDPTPPSPDNRPTNALLGLGIHPENGLVYYTVTCTGPNASDLKGFVYSFDPTAATPVFTQELEIPLNFSLQTGGTGQEGTYGTMANAPWSTSANNAVVSNTTDNNMVEQPWLADVVFDVQPDGTIYMLVGGRNRFTDAVSGSRITTGQGMWIASLSNTTWSLETNGVVGNRTTDNVLTLPWFSVRNGNGVFFNTNGSEGADGTGNLVAVPGFTEVALSGVDNVKSGGNNGVSFMSRNNGSRTRDILLLGSLVSGAPDRTGVYKANVWGEVEALLEPAPLEVGNYVFKDVNKNGLQDPSDLPIAGVTVSLVEDTNNDGLPNETAVASTTTDANGQYYFDQTDGLKYDTKYVLVINKATDFTTGALASMSATVANVSSDSKDSRDSDGELLGTNQYVKVAFTTGGPGENNHLFDFGFIDPPCDAPVVAVSTSQTICQGGTFELPLSATVTSGTATGYQWYFTDASGTSFTAISGATSLTFSPTTAQQPASAGGTRYYAVSAYSNTTACVSEIAFVSLTVKPTQTITFTTPSSATVTQCSNTTLNMSVTTNAKFPDQIQFVYFNAPTADPYTGGTILGTVTSGTLASNTVSLNKIQLPKTTDIDKDTIIVYAILVSADGVCKPSASRVIFINPQPEEPSIGGDDIVCRNTAITLTTESATAYRWFNLSTSPATSLGTTQTITPTISASVTTYGLSVSNALGCYSDTARFVVTPVVCNPCTAGAGKVGGNVYTDYNGDGIKAASGETGLSGITVTIYACSSDGASSTLVATTTTDLNGDYFFAGLTDGKAYRVEFVDLPAGYLSTAKGTNNGTTVQFVTSPICGVSLGLNMPSNYCQTNPLLVTPCYLDGAVTPNTTGGSDVLVGVNYDLTGSVYHLATRTQLGSTWGVGYAKTTKKLYTAAFLKRHVGLLNGKLGQIYVNDLTNPGSTSAIPWLDVSTLTGITGNWTFLTDAQRGLGNAGTPSVDSLAFSNVALSGLGDIDVSEDDKTLYVMDLTNRQLLAIDIATKALLGKYPVPQLCDTAPSTSYFSAGASNATFTSTDGKLWKKGYLFDVLATSTNYAQTITNPNSATAGTSNAALYANSASTTTSMRYSFPVGNGTFGVKLHLATNSVNSGKNMTVKAEGVAVPTLTNFSTLSAAGGINIGITRSFTTTVTDGVLTLDFVNNTGGGAALVSGFELTTLNGTPTGETRPFALAVHNGKVYVGAICDASHSQKRSDMQASVLEFDPVAGTYNPTPILTFPLDYPKGANAGNGRLCNNSWEPWTSIYPNNTANGIFCDGLYFDIYAQPVLSDIAFDVDGSLMLGFFDRMGHQMGAIYNYRPDHTVANGLQSHYGAVGGDILRAYFNGTSYELESNAKEGASSSKPATAGQNTNQGPGGGEFYYGDATFSSATTGHFEISAGGLAFKPGSGEIRLTAGDPLGYSTGGLLGLDNKTGAKLTAKSYTLYSGSTGGVQNKANGLGDLELLCNPAPIQIGNRVWRDDNQNGIQDPCEPSIPGAVVKLYDAAKTTVIASATTNAAGEYYFSSTTITAGTSTSSVSTSLLTYNTTYGLVLTSLGSSTVVTGLSLTNVSPLTPGESGTLNSGTTLANNDAKLDVVGGISSPCIKLTTGGLGDINHTYDFGITIAPCAKPTLTAIPSQTLCQGTSFSMPLVSSIVSNTVTSLQWYLTNAAGTSFTAISGATSLSLSAAQAVVPTVGQSKYYALIGQNGLSALCSDTVFVNLALKATPVLTITTPSANTVTQCSSGTMAFSVSSNAVAPDNISLVYFTTPQSGTAMYTGGTSLGTITSTTVAGTKTLSYTAELPSNPTSTSATIYVYALLSSSDGACKLSDGVVVNLRPDFTTTIAGTPYVCKGSSATLVALAAEGSTIRWSTGQSGVDLVAVNPVVSATATSPIVYSVTVVDANGCSSIPGSYTVTPVICNSCTSSSTSIGGNVFQDYNADGTTDATDRRIAGVTVTLFVCDVNGTSTQVFSTTTDLSGAYSFTGLTPGTTYRVEFSNLPAGYMPTYRGANNGTTVQFVQPGTCNASLGINVSFDYCQTDPGFAVVCFTRNTDGSTEPTIIDMKYSTGQNFSPTSTVDNSTDWGKPVGATSYSVAAHTTVATKGDVGTTFGLAWDRQHQQLLSGAMMRGYAPMQTNASTSGFGEATIYKINYGTGAAGTKSVWLDLETVYGDDFAGTFVADNNYPSTRSFGTTNGNPKKIGYTGLGSMQFARDNHELYTVNLKTLEVLVIPVASDGSAVTDQIKRFPFPTDGCPTGSWSDGRPYRAALGLGVHPVTNRVYATLTCTGPTKADLKGIVYSFDPSDSSPSSADFRRELDIPLGIKIPATNANSAPYYGQIVHPWDVVTANSASTTGYVDNFDNNSQHSQPWLGEIEFDRQADGTYGLMVGTRNRFDDIINSSSYVAGGLLFRVFNAGTDVAPDWQLEKYGTAGTFVSTVNYTFSSGRAGTYTDSQNRFFKYEGNEGTMLAGTSDYIPGRTEIILPASDNVYNSSTSGITWLHRLTGDRSRDNRLLGDFTSAGYDAANFTKANNWGGLVVMCSQEPIQIGNRVWRDDNQNGIQDPCEPPIPGVVVTLYNAAKTTAIASATTNAAGEYYFSSLTLTAGTSTSSVATTALQYNTTYNLVITSLGSSTAVTSAGLSLTDVSPVTPGESGTINSGLTPINNDAKLDSGKPCIKLTTGGAGDINHTYDFGLVKFVCSLTVTAQASSQTTCIGVPVTLTAQVSPVSSYTYVWSAPVGVTLTGANTATATATASVAGLQTFTVTVSSSPTCFTTATVSVSIVDCAPTLAIDVTDAGTCLNTSNVYTTTGILSLTNAIAGIATFTDGAVSTTVAVSAGATSVPYSLSGLDSGTGLHTVTVSYASQTASATYTAPVSCTLASTCLVTAVATPGLCQSATNTYTSTVVVRLTNPIAGVLTVTDGVTSLTFATQSTAAASFTATFNGLPSTGASHTVTASLPGCSTTTTTYTAPASCTVAPLLASLGDYVWLDTNRNGQQDGNETGVANVTAVLCDAVSGTVVSTTLTDGSGKYLFINLNPGSYVVKFTAPSGTTFTTADSGPDVSDSDVASTTGTKGSTGVYSLSAGEQNLTVDAGLVPLLASLGDYVWYDVNKNGQQDGNETGVAGVTVKLFAPTSSTVTPIASLTTDGNGRYLFTNLEPGVYCVVFEKASLPTGYTLTSANSGPDESDSDANPLTGKTGNYTLAAGEQNLTVDAGIVAPVTKLSLEKFVSKSKAKLGDVLTYTLIVTNTGVVDAINVTVRDSSSRGLNYVANSATVPIGTTFTQGAPISNWRIGSITAGQSLSMTFQAVADSSGILYNQATIPDDTARVCTTVPITVCKGSNYLFQLVAPSGRGSYRWFRDNVEIVDQTTNILNVSQPGSYSLAADSESGQCVDFSCCPFIVEEDTLPSFRAVAVPVTCIGNVPQANGKLVLSGFNAAYTYQYSLGSSFSESASLSGAKKTIPSDGVIVSNLANPAVPLSYTVRVYNGAGCYTDLTVMLSPANCDCPKAVCVPLVIKMTKGKR